MNAPAFYCPPPTNVCNTPSPGRVLTTVFSASGTYQPSPGLISLVVECVGGGGGGGGAIASAVLTANSGWATGGGGGGSGGYSRKTLPASLVAGGVVVTIGAGGAGGPNNAPGSTGATTSFGALCVANGGGPGRAGDTAISSWGEPGDGAPPGIGDLAVKGNGGSQAAQFYYSTTDAAPGPAVSGKGGASHFGGAGINWFALAGETNTINGGDGTMGSGGDGGVSGTSTYPAGGGTGGTGVCVITEYCGPPPPTPPSGSGCVNVPACPPGQQWGYWNE
jgi:hypothetical protein